MTKIINWLILLVGIPFLRIAYRWNKDQPIGQEIAELLQEYDRKMAK